MLWGISYFIYEILFRRMSIKNTFKEKQNKKLIFAIFAIYIEILDV